MAEKISEASWKAFIKKQKLPIELEDKDLLKALARLDKSDERQLAPHLEALDAVIKEIPKQVAALVKVKAKLGDKPFGIVKDELYTVLDEVEKQHKATQAALKAQQSKEDEDGEDEDAAPSALVNPKLLFKQLTLCRNDPERTMKFAFVDAGKDQPAMLALHPRMSARALFAKLQAAAGVKAGAYGSAWVDGTSLMLQLDKPLSGLVKKVRAPVKASGFKIAKAVLWNEDGTVFEEDEAPEDAPAEPTQDAPAEAGTASGTAGTIPKAPPAPAQTYQTRLAVLLPRVKKAAEAHSPDAVKFARLLEFAAGKAQAEDFLGAIAALRQVEQLLDAAPSTTAAPSTGTVPGAPTPGSAPGSTPGPRPEAAVDAGTAFKARMGALVPTLSKAKADGHPGALDAHAKATAAGAAAAQRDFVRAQALLDEAEELLARHADAAPAGAPPKGVVAFQKSRILWVGARQKMLAETRRLADQIAVLAEGEEDAAELREAAEAIVRNVSRIDERLQDVLDQITTAAEGPERERLKRDARDVLADYQDLLADGLFTTIDNNPILQVGVAAPARAALAAIARTLA